MYRNTLNTADVISADTALTQNVYTQIGTYTVPADLEVGMGYGPNSAQDTAEGRIYADFVDTAAADVNGKFRIRMASSQDQPVGDAKLGISPIILDIDTAALRQGAASRPGQIPFPFTKALLTKDKKFVFEIKCSDAGKTLDLSACTVLMDITANLV